jgi:hypothetical protein
MPTSTQVSMFCITAAVLILTPGPNFIYVLTRGTTQGRRPALMAAVGLGWGSCCIPCLPQQVSPPFFAPPIWHFRSSSTEAVFI